MLYQLWHSLKRNQDNPIILCREKDRSRQNASAPNYEAIKGINTNKHLQNNIFYINKAWNNSV